MPKTRKNKKKLKTAKKKFSFVVGLISVPLTPTKKYFKVCGDSYTASSHITWLRKRNIKTLIIPYNTKKHEYYMSKIHGLYLPSGGAFASTQMEYYKCCKKMLQLAMKKNDKGNYFPVWGCCMGFQQMLIIADGNDNVDNLLTKFDSYKNLLCKMNLTDAGKKSRIINGLDKKTLHDITKKKSTLNNHMLGISPRDMLANQNISDFYHIVGISCDRKKKTIRCNN